ncbi:diphthamide synthesis protein [Candidatus Pacearchaeota archaeon]|nr:diphthamide synthesis protein [Candidatus Pacearchaeota archaeon]
MIKKTITEIEQEYELELDSIIKKTKERKAKTILLQFPDGLKPYAKVIVDELERKSEKHGIKAEFFIWMGSCFGACDIPNIKDIDLLVQFGHTPWKSRNNRGF